MKKKFKLLSFVLSLIMAVSCFSSFGIPAFADTEGGFIYRVEGTEAVLTGIENSLSGNIVVPEKLGGYDVVMVDGAFKFKTNITSVTLPDTVTVITNESFSNCSLRHITFSNNLSRIGQEAFFACAYLQEAVLPNSLMQLGQYAFSGCAALQSVVISSGLGYIEKEVFNGCSELAAIDIPDNINYLGKDSFSDTLYYNTESNWEDGVLYIGKHLVAARSAEILGRYVVKEGTKSISDSAFFRCSNLTEVVFPLSLKRIDLSAFYFCENLKHVFYAGTVDQRHAIRIEKNNSSVSNSTWHYSYDPDVIEYYPGDIDGDGFVDNKDLVCIFKYLSNWEVEVQPTVLDVNGDKSVNNKDVVRLFQYLSGWDVKIYSSNTNFDYSGEDTGPVISF